MSAPVSYQTKEPHSVQAMQYDAWDGTTDVQDWIGSLLTASFEEETITFNFNGYNAFEVYVGEDYLFRVESGQYVYLDEDGFHATSKGSFEMIYKKSPTS